MPREPRKTDNRWDGETVPRQFRLRADTVAHLDRLVAWLSRNGVPHSRTDAIRHAASVAAEQIPSEYVVKTTGKKLPKNRKTA